MGKTVAASKENSNHFDKVIQNFESNASQFDEENDLVKASRFVIQNKFPIIALTLMIATGFAIFTLFLKPAPVRPPTVFTHFMIQNLRGDAAMFANRGSFGIHLVSFPSLYNRDDVIDRFFNSQETAFLLDSHKKDKIFISDIDAKRTVLGESVQFSKDADTLVLSTEIDASLEQKRRILEIYLDVVNRTYRDDYIENINLQLESTKSEIQRYREKVLKSNEVISELIDLESKSQNSLANQSFLQILHIKKPILFLEKTRSEELYSYFNDKFESLTELRKIVGDYEFVKKQSSIYHKSYEQPKRNTPLFILAGIIVGFFTGVFFVFVRDTFKGLRASLLR